MPRRDKPVDRLLELARSARLRVEGELEVFGRRGRTDAAVAETLTQARDALKVLEATNERFTHEIRAQADIAGEACTAQLGRLGDDDGAARSALTVAERALRAYCALMLLKAEMGTGGRRTSTGPGRGDRRSRGPYGPTKPRRPRS